MALPFKMVFKGLGAKLMCGALLGYTLCLFVGTLAPFDFTLDSSRLASRREPVEWVPFSYVCPKCGYDLKNRALNFVMFVPFGLCLGLCLTRSSGLRSVVLVATSGLLISLTIETAQYFIPQRKPSGSDLVLNAVGSLAGGAMAVAARRIWRAERQKSECQRTEIGGQGMRMGVGK